MVVGELPLDGKIVVITGAGSGINLEFAKLAHQRNSQVVIGDVRLTPEAEEWIATTKGSASKVVYQQTDVAKWDQLQSLLDVSEKEFGDVPDLYVAGAGVFEPEWSNFWEDPETDGYKSIDINVAHAIKFTRMSIRKLLSKNKKGVILVVGSVAGQTPNFTGPLYVATKHAISGFVRSLAMLDEYMDIKVVCSAPGMVLTRLWTDRPDMTKNYKGIEQIALGPKDIAESMVALAESSKYEGGTVLEVAKGQPWREVPAYNAPPPAGVGTKPEQSAADVRILEILKKERGIALKS